MLRGPYMTRIEICFNEPDSRGDRVNFLFEAKAVRLWTHRNEELSWKQREVEGMIRCAGERKNSSALDYTHQYVQSVLDKTNNTVRVLLLVAVKVKTLVWWWHQNKKVTRQWVSKANYQLSNLLDFTVILSWGRSSQGVQSNMGLSSGEQEYSCQFYKYLLVKFWRLWLDDLIWWKVCFWETLD